MRRLRIPGLLLLLLACGGAAAATPELSLRITGQVVITQLEAVQKNLAARGNAVGDARLGAVAVRLGQMAQTLQQDLGADASKPVDLIGKSLQGKVWHAYAAAQRAEAYLAACTGCHDNDAAAMTNALLVTVDKLVAAPDGSGGTPPVIDAVETLDHRPLFVLRQSASPLAFALIGKNLFDTRCADPQVTATDVQGVPSAVQPTVTGASPTRIELTVPAGARLTAGAYVLHVVTARKGLLFGCKAQPEALAVVQVARPNRLTVSYTLAAMCRMPGNGGAAAVKTVALDAGTLPDITRNDATVRKQVTISGCTDPVSYAVSAKVSFADGKSASIGPIVQSAAASIIAGLPGGLSLNWDPAVQTIVVHSGANSCKGVY